ncbi:S66 family peptidase [Senegalia sp. (in: firmicutes)]|uniref:S66 family peptidase n=1 Tax=Senegalia sp. (in: firmicutes) TaxID=1924098 RepID=UPI003F96DF70
MINKLKIGDTIGFFSPSSPITALCPKRFERSKEFLLNKGFKLKQGKLTGKKDFYRSGSIKKRAEELNELIRDKEVRCIISTIGGMNSNSILPYIDYETFKKDPKIIIGYSDITAILFAIYAKTGITTFYGPALVASFGEMEPFNEMTYKYFKDILIAEDNIPYEYKMPEIWTEEYIDWESQYRGKKENKNKWITLSKGKVKGRLIIGNLNTMTGIWGSEYMPEIKKGDILFIEDSLKEAATIERSFAMLKVNKVFDKIGGLILGKHEIFDDMGSKRKPYEILEEVIGEYDFPFLAEVDCSHTHPMFTMPIGGMVELDASNKRISLISRNLNEY